MVSQVPAPWADGNFMCPGKPWWSDPGDSSRAREVKPKKQEPIREAAPSLWPEHGAVEEAQDALPGSFNLNWNTTITVRA